MSDGTEPQTPESTLNPFSITVGKTQAEAGSMVDSRVKESGNPRNRMLKQAGEKIDEVKERVGDIYHRATEAKAKTTDTLDNLEQLFEDRVTRALKRLGIPTHDDVQGIARQLETMNALLKTLADHRDTATTTLDEKKDLKRIDGIGPVLEG